MKERIGETVEQRYREKETGRKQTETGCGIVVSLMEKYLCITK